MTNEEKAELQKAFARAYTEAARTTVLVIKLMTAPAVREAFTEFARLTATSGAIARRAVVAPVPPSPLSLKAPAAPHEEPEELPGVM